MGAMGLGAVIVSSCESAPLAPAGCCTRADQAPGVAQVHSAGACIRAMRSRPVT